jgi:hypothetical protein
LGNPRPRARPRLNHAEVGRALHLRAHQATTRYT